VLLLEIRTLRQGGIDEAKLTVGQEYSDNPQIQVKYISSKRIAKELVTLEDLRRVPVSGKLGWKESERNFGDGTRTYLRGVVRSDKLSGGRDSRDHWKKRKDACRLRAPNGQPPDISGIYVYTLGDEVCAVSVYSPQDYLPSHLPLDPAN
jgi:hypothetical protein